MTTAPLIPRFLRPRLGLLLSCGMTACTSGASLGEYPDTDTDGATATGSGPSTDASSGDPDTDTDAACVEDCDPDFGVAFVRGQNAERLEITRLGSELCADEACPDQDPGSVVACLDSDEASGSPLGVQEFCRFSASSLTQAFEVGFTTPVLRSSFELLREDPVSPGALEAYTWFPEVLEVRGPGTSYRGAVTLGFGQTGPDDLDLFSSVTNLACAERLTAQGIEWTDDGLEAACLGTWDDMGVTRPLRMQPQAIVQPTQGKLSSRSGWSCSSPDADPDTCCASCDRATGPLVGRYGIDESGARRTVAASTAISCDPDADPLRECAELRLDVDREDGEPYAYAWDAQEQSWPLPLADKLRETHPDRRPAGLVSPGRSCTSSNDCSDGQGCYGRLPDGTACRDTAACGERTCQPEWFGTCAETVGGEGYCVDRRFDPVSAGACWVRDDDPQVRLSACDLNESVGLDDPGCCDPALGGEEGCEPFEQPGIQPVARYDRDSDLAATASCVCAAGQPELCEDTVSSWCEPPLGEGTEPSGASDPDAYALQLVSRSGGVRFDEGEETLSVRLANFGDLGRARTESCAERRGIGRRSAADGWVANERITAERLADHDLALCSGSTYELVFADSSALHHVRSEGGGTLDGRASFVIETAQFRTVSGSVGSAEDGDATSCGRFEVAFTNDVDPGPLNLSKLELRAGGPQGETVAGGSGCAATPDDGAVPCLRVGFQDELRSIVGFEIDEAVHGQVLSPGQTYTLVIPGLSDIEEMQDAQAYAAAFHDACGMPLLDSPEREMMSFTVEAACE